MQKIMLRTLWVLIAVSCLISAPTIYQPLRAAQASRAPGIPIDKSSIGGVVVNADNQTPEVGVWVIAETKALPVPFREIVVTDDQGRFLVPDLPEGPYELWVRGYGLKDSASVKASRGEQISIQVTSAKDPQEAARIYPASYWTSLIQPPTKKAIPDHYSSRDEWIADWRAGCNQCHQLGMVATRRYTHPDDWNSIFQRNPVMKETANRLGMQLLAKTLADWDTQIKAGEVPPAPPRPLGIERNVVVSQWDWGANDSFIHDLNSTDKRNPTLYPYGKVYGADRVGGGRLWVLDPMLNTVTKYQVQPRDPKGYDAELDFYHLSLIHI